jgi:Mg-chelatase subunit ChlD
MMTNLQNRTDIGAGLEDLLEQGDQFFVKNRDTILMPVIITDGQPTI